MDVGKKTCWSLCLLVHKKFHPCIFWALASGGLVLSLGSLRTKHPVFHAPHLYSGSPYIILPYGFWALNIVCLSGYCIIFFNLFLLIPRRTTYQSFWSVSNNLSRYRDLMFYFTLEAIVYRKMPVPSFLKKNTKNNLLILQFDLWRVHTGAIFYSPVSKHWPVIKPKWGACDTRPLLCEHAL